MDPTKIMNTAAKKMQSFVSVVTESNWESFIERERATKHKVLLFTEKKTTPTIYKALSKKYLQRLNMGEVKNTEEALVKKFGITAFPTIIALTDPENAEFDKYEGEMNIDQLTKFLGNYAYSTPKKVQLTDFVELTDKKMKGGSNSLCGPKSTNICVIILTDDKAVLDPLKPVLEYFANDPVSFVYISAKDEPYIHQTVFGSNSAVLYKAKRGKYMPLPIDSADSLKAAVSDALGGGGSLIKTTELLFGQAAEVQTEL